MNNATLVELHIDDFESAKRFYSGLGFAVIWERTPEASKGYLVMGDDHNTLCFWGGNKEIYDHPYFGQYARDTKRGYGVELVLMVPDLDVVYERARRFAKVVEPMELRPWGLRDFRLEDPFGFYVRVTTLHDIRDPGNAVP